jgi:hypothetical protein
MEGAYSLIEGLRGLRDNLLRRSLMEVELDKDSTELPAKEFGLLLDHELR